MASQLAGLDDRTIGFIRWKAHRLCGHGVFAGQDAQDLKQELFLECWRKSTQFDPAKSGSRTFLQKVINNRICNLVEAQSAERRDYRSCQCSLNDAVALDKSGPFEFGDSVSDADYATRMGRGSLSAHERTELQIDVDKVIATLPRELAAIATLLKSSSLVETARQLHISRATLYRRIADIRTVFTTAGLNVNRRRHEQERLIGAAPTSAILERDDFKMRGWPCEPAPGRHTAVVKLGRKSSSSGLCAGGRI